jgi:hypothetical protein
MRKIISDRGIFSLSCPTQKHYLCNVKKALIFFLLLQFVSHQLFLREWAKLPALFTHFQEHKTEKRSFTDFASFFQAHYGCSQHKFSEDHSRLPFQEEIAGGQNIQLFFSPESPILITRSYQLKKDRLPVYRPSWKSTDASAIWQPPKIG